jgi:hypothetical protein
MIFSNTAFSLLCWTLEIMLLMPHKIDRAIILDIHCPSFVGNKGDKSGIKAPLKLSSSKTL